MSTLDDIKKIRAELEKRTEKVLKKKPDKYALVKEIAAVVWVGYNAFSGGWLKFLSAVGIEIVKRVRAK